MKKIAIVLICLIAVLALTTVALAMKSSSECVIGKEKYTTNVHPVWISQYNPFTGKRTVVKNVNDDFATVTAMGHKDLEYAVFTGKRIILKHVDAHIGLKNIQDYTACVGCY